MMTRLRPSRGFISAKSSWSNLDSNGIRQVVYQWVIFETTGFLERCQLTEMSLPEFLAIQDRTNLRAITVLLRDFGRNGAASVVILWCVRGEMYGKSWSFEATF